MIEILLIFLGSLTWVLTMFKSGLVYPFGMGFWGANGHDAIWHLAVIERLIKGGFSNPVFAGESLRNYHFGFDILVAFLNKISLIKTSVLYFQILPIIFSILIGYFFYKFILDWKKSKLYAFFSLFFIYFSGSFGWIVEFLREKKFDGESMFWSQQSISTLINPPYALSLIFILVGIINLKKYIEEEKLKNLLLSILSFGLLIQIKSYAGVLVLLSLFTVGLFNFLKSRDLKILKVFTFSLGISLIVFLPFNRETESFFVFKPFWFLETMVSFSDRFNWQRLYLALEQVKYTGFTLKALFSYLLAFVIFIVGNFGTRIIAFFQVKEIFKKGKDKYIDIFLLTIAFFGVVIPTFFIQEGTPWNSIQFFYYSLFVFSMYAGFQLAKIFEKKKIANMVSVGIIVIFTIPTSLSTLYFHYLPKRAPAKLSLGEFEALDFLSKQEDGIVLTYPYDQEKAKSAEVDPPRPLYLYESTAYVSAFSKKQVFLEDEVNLEITGYDWKQRKEEVLNFYQTLDREEAKEFMKGNNISYVYLVKPQRALLGESQLNLEKIFENSEVNIYKIIR